MTARPITTSPAQAAWLRRALSAGRDDAAQLLVRLERAIALVERCQPLDYRREVERVLAAWRNDDPIAPSFVYRPPPDMDPIRRALDALAAAFRVGEAREQWLADRAEELSLEACMVQAVGQPRLAELARMRFSAAPEDVAAAEAWAADWCAHTPAADAEPTYSSDDERSPDSLFSSMQREIGRRRLPWRVVLRENLGSVAAAGEGVVYVRTRTMLRRIDAQRIVLHEIEGHVAPRHRAAQAAEPLFRCGTRGASDDEEGRALWLERSNGFFDVHRRSELGMRHRAALGVRAGATWSDTVRSLRDAGSALEPAVHIASRVHRGGGLAREYAYLPALARVERAFAERPDLERLLGSGRLGLEVAARWPADAAGKVDARVQSSTTITGA